MRLPSIFKNKYFLTITFFAIWMLFFDMKDVVTQYHRTQELNALQASKAHYEKEISQIRSEVNALKTDPRIIEQYAREKYYMKRDNEELFIIIDNQ